MLKAFVINLERRKDRLESFNKEIGNLFDLTIEKAVDYKELRLTQKLKKRINSWNFTYVPHKVLNLVGACLSHLSVWRKISKMKIPYAFVFEDDCAFMYNIDFLKTFNNLKLPNEFGIIWLNDKISDVPLNTKYPDENPKITEVTDMVLFTAESYIITPFFASQLINAIENDLGAVDAHMFGYMKKTKGTVFKITPPIFCQKNRNDTDIQI